MALAVCGCWSPRRPDSCASRSARRMMSSSARSMRRRRLTAHRPRRRRRMAGQCGHPVRGVPRRREARRGPGAARWTAGSAAAGGRMGVGVATRLPRQGRNRPRGELMTSRECETAISYPRHGEIHDHHPAAEHCSRLRGRGHRRRPAGCGAARTGGCRPAGSRTARSSAPTQSRLDRTAAIAHSCDLCRTLTGDHSRHSTLRTCSSAFAIRILLRRANISYAMSCRHGKLRKRRNSTPETTYSLLKLLVIGLYHCAMRRRIIANATLARILHGSVA